MDSSTKQLAKLFDIASLASKSDRAFNVGLGLSCVSGAFLLSGKFEASLFAGILSMPIFLAGKFFSEERDNCLKPEYSPTEKSLRMAEESKPVVGVY